MTSGSTVLSLKNITKKYQVNGKDYYVLKNVTFDLRSGEIIGIIGPNGAGKSTLLKILAEVIQPSDGTIEVNGNILSILEFGTGFHPDLSGFENIFLNAALSGMRKKEIHSKVDEIVEFSGIQHFIHEPVKNYSSGMYLRLAMSIALFTNAGILLFDEVISVGDAEFRHKALEKVKELVAQGRSCILVTHDLNSALTICDNCILLEQGCVTNIGKSKQVIEAYLNKVNTDIIIRQPQTTKHKKCDYLNLTTHKEQFFTNEEVMFKIRYYKKVTEAIDIVVEIRNLNFKIMSDCEIYRESYISKESPIGTYETICCIPSNLLSSGNYFIDVIFGDKVSKLITVSAAGRFTVQLPDWEKNKKWNEGNDNIPLRPHFSWKTNPLYDEH